MNRIVIFLVLLAFIYACNSETVYRYRTEDLKKELEKGRIDTVLKIVGVYPIEMIDKELAEMLILKAPANDIAFKFFTEAGCKMKSRKILDNLDSLQDQYITCFLKDSIDDVYGKEYYILKALYFQQSDSLNNSSDKWFKFWDENALKCANINLSAARTDSSINKYWFCRKNAFYSAYLLNHYGSKEFTKIKLDSLEKISFRYGKETKPARYNSDTLIYKPTTVKLVLKIDSIENMEFSETPVIKDSYDLLKIKSQFEAVIFTNKTRSLLFMYGGIGHANYYIEMIDSLTLKVYLLSKDINL